MAQFATVPKQALLSEKIAQLETKIALLTGDIHQLQASLESNILSEEMRARIRRMIEKTLETLHIKAIEEKQQLTRTEERQKEVERKQVELNQYIRHYAELQHRQEELHRKPRRKSKPKPLGKQKVTGQITGIEGGFVTFTVLKAEMTDNPHRADIKSHTVGTVLTKKKQTILKGEPHRLHWSEEDVRAVLLAESGISG